VTGHISAREVHVASTFTPSSAATHRRVEATVARIVGRPVAWLALVGLLASWPVVWAARTPIPPPLPVLGAVPPFALVDQDGGSFGSDALAGRVWIASFIFTRCETVCPVITARMAEIQARTRNLEPSLHLVSFSVDPEFDTPTRLAAYARAHRASPRMWTFLTGAPAAVQEAVVRGLRTAMEADPTASPGGAVLHGTHLVLVDGRGRIRGYYATDAEDLVPRLVRDAALLVNRP
jgi:protein SCO1